MEFTEEQEKIFDFILHGLGNARVNAGAGCGKTSTLIEGAKRYVNTYKDKTVLMIAFNKSIAEELAAKIENSELDEEEKKRISVKTSHVLGYGIINQCYGQKENEKIDLDENKYRTHLMKIIDRASEGLYGQMDVDEQSRYVTSILKIFDFGRYYLCQTEKEMAAVADKMCVSHPYNEVAVAFKMMDWGIEHLRTVDFTDMIWLPNVMRMDFRRRYDLVIIDEAQDLSKAQQKLFSHFIRKRTGRFIAIGDKFQCIYGWCGSDENSFDNFSEMENTISLPLNTNFRCSRKIISFVNSRFPNIPLIHSDFAIEGDDVNMAANVFFAKGGDMVICRNMAPLGGLYEKFAERGKTCLIVGDEAQRNDVKEILEKFTNDTPVDSNFSTRKGVIPQLYDGFFTRLGKEMKKRRTDNFEMVLREPEIYAMLDRVRMVENISKSAQTFGGVKDILEKAFFDNQKLNPSKYVRLSTIHKAKGLEADNVYLLCPKLIPSKLAETAWQKQEEENLRYVAYTRAKKHLNIVSEEIFSSEPYLYGNKITGDDIKEKILKCTSLFGKNYFKQDNKLYQKITGTTESIRELAAKKGGVSLPKVNPKNRKIGGNRF